jgi:hypothetical protein
MARQASSFRAFRCARLAASRGRRRRGNTGAGTIGALRFPILYAQIALGKAPDDDLSRDKKFGKKLTAATGTPRRSRTEWRPGS